MRRRKLSTREWTGDIAAVYNESGTKLVSYKYDAWGNFTTTYHNSGENTYAVNNPFTYRGYYYDRDLEMYYLGSRYYDSVVKRFINADKFIATKQGLSGHNMFAYCNNSPINYVDYTGDLYFSIFVIVTAATIAVVGLLSMILHDTPVDSDSDAIIKSEDETKQLFYGDVDADGYKDQALNVEGSLGIYKENDAINDYNSLELEFFKFGASLGITKGSLGVYLFECKGKNTALNLFGKQIEVSFGVNYGLGAQIGLGKKSMFGISVGMGFIISLEVLDEEE